MPSLSPSAPFARAKKARRAQKAEEPPAAATIETPGRISPGLRLVLASLAVVLLFFGQRLQNPQPWSYDEYYHLGLAREMLSSGLRMETFRWTPFSITHDHFADGEPLFHVLLLPFARLPLRTAGMLGVLLGQIFLVGSFAAALWIVRAPRPWWFVLALGGLGTLFAQRMEMCRPHVWLIGFTVLVAALLVERRWKALFAVCALFALTHAAAWIAIPLAILWAVCGLIVRGEDGERRFPGSRSPPRRAAGSLGQLIHPDVPENFRLFVITNFVIPFQAATASNAALHSQLGTELSPPGLDLLLEQWPAFIPPVLVAIALLSRPQLRTRATLTVGAHLARLPRRRELHDPPVPGAGGAAGAARPGAGGAGVAGSQAAAAASGLGADGRRGRRSSWGSSGRSSGCAPTAFRTPRRRSGWRPGWASTARPGSASSPPSQAAIPSGAEASGTPWARSPRNVQRIPRTIAAPAAPPQPGSGGGSLRARHSSATSARASSASGAPSSRNRRITRLPATRKASEVRPTVSVARVRNRGRESSAIATRTGGMNAGHCSSSRSSPGRESSVPSCECRAALLAVAAWNGSRSW